MYRKKNTFSDTDSSSSSSGDESEDDIHVPPNYNFGGHLGFQPHGHEVGVGDHSGEIVKVISILLTLGELTLHVKQKFSLFA